MAARSTNHSLQRKLNHATNYSRGYCGRSGEAKFGRRLTSRALRHETALILAGSNDLDNAVFPKFQRTSGWLTW